MGLFDVFGGAKKKEAEERAIEERKIKEHDELVAQQKEAHKDLHWPVMPRINRMNVKDTEVKDITDPISPERKDEIGAYVFEPKITQDMVKGLDLQELMFLLGTYAAYNRYAPLKDYETNHRTLYNEMLRRIHEAKELYIIYDKKTGYPLLDGGYADVYLDKDHAETAVQQYKAQFRDAVSLTRPGEGADPLPDGSRAPSLFDFLYYVGIENVIIDNGWYKAAIKRSEIAAPLNFNLDNAAAPPCSPELCHAMIDFIQEITWPVKYDKREEIIKKKQERMFRQIAAAKYIIPTQLRDKEDPKPEEIGTNAAKEIKFPILKSKDLNYIPVYTDMFEYNKAVHLKEFKPAAFDYKTVLRFTEGVDGILINSHGQKVIISKEQARKIAES